MWVLFGPMRNDCLFGLVMPWDTTRTLCLHERVIVISHIGLRRKFLTLYKYGFFLTLSMRFKLVRTLLGSRADNIYTIESGSLHFPFNMSLVAKKRIILDEKCLGLFCKLLKLLE